MGGKSTQQQTTDQTQTTNPWGPSQGLLTGILGQAGGMLGNTGPTANEQGALNTLTANAQSGNPYASAIGGYASNLLGGGGAMDQSGNISNALSTYQQQLSPYANGSQVGQITPQLQSYLDTIRSDVSNQVNGMFAGAGRDLSGANQQALARGISQGEAAPLLSQYNQDIQNQLGAAGSLYGAGNTTGGLLSGLNQTSLQNQGQGVDAATAALQARDSSANQLLNIGQTARGIPQGALGFLAQLGVPIAQLGGTTNRVGTTTGTSNMSPAQQAWGWMNSFANLNRSGGGGGG